MTDHRSNPNDASQVPAINAIEKLLEARMSLGHLINDTHSFSNNDYELIGKFIQTYCIADIEARRVINCLTHIKTGKPTTYALKLNDKDALDHLLVCADGCVWNRELAADIRKAGEIFVEHRKLRHVFAHWAGRRIPGYDAFIFFTASFGAQRAPTGAVTIEEQDDANMQYVVMQISHILDEQLKLQGHAQYLATIGTELDSRATEIAERFSADVANGKFESKAPRNRKQSSA